MHKIFVICVAAIAVFAGCQAAKKEAAPVAQPIEPVRKALVIDGFKSPESVTSDAEGKRFFVSNMGELKPSAKDNDGFITELTPEGKVVNMRLLPKEGVRLDSPKGITVLGSVLYVTDVDRLLGFDINTREKVFELSFANEKTAFLNDPAVLDKDTLLVSATDVGKIYKVSLGGKMKKPSYAVFMDNVPGANGLFYDFHSGYLFVTSFATPPAKGSLGVIKVTDKKPQYKVLSKDVGLLDGVALVKGEGVVFSDWVAFDKPGRLLGYVPSSGALREIPLSEPVKGPADFFVDAKTGNLWMPRMIDGKVQIEKPVE